MHNYRKANMELVNSASHGSCILIRQLKRKPPEFFFKSCHKLINTFVQVATVRRASLHETELKISNEGFTVEKKS